MLGLGIGVNKENVKSFEGELDKLGISQNAVFIFSPYKRLVKSYAGKSIRVQRTSDYTSMDIGFHTDGTINQSELMSFCGSGDGLVEIVYNQSGYSNAIQTGITAKPKVVAAGVFQASGIFFDGTNDSLSVEKYSQIDFTAPPFTCFLKVNNPSTRTGYYFSINTDSGTFNQYGLLNSTTDLLFKINSINLSNTYEINKEENLLLGLANTGVNGKFNKSNLSETFQADVNPVKYDFFNIGARGASLDNSIKSVFWGGFMKQIIIFNDNQYSNYNNLKNI